MKKNLIILALCLTIVGCGSKQYSNDIEKVMAENEYIVVDVRSAWEYNKGHVVNAINIPYETIDENTNLDKDKVIFVYCQSGGRSAIAFEMLKNLGYTVYDLGGYDSVNLPKEVKRS